MVDQQNFATIALTHGRALQQEPSLYIVQPENPTGFTYLRSIKLPLDFSVSGRSSSSALGFPAEKGHISYKYLDKKLLWLIPNHTPCS